MRIEISSSTHGTLTWELPQDLSEGVESLSEEQQKVFKKSITKMLDEYFLFLTTALGEKNAAEELEKIWQMQKLLMSEILKGSIVFKPRDQLGRSN